MCDTNINTTAGNLAGNLAGNPVGNPVDNADNATNTCTDPECFNYNGIHFPISNIKRNTFFDIMFPIDDTTGTRNIFDITDDFKYLGCKVCDTDVNISIDMCKTEGAKCVKKLIEFDNKFFDYPIEKPDEIPYVYYAIYDETEREKLILDFYKLVSEYVIANVIFTSDEKAKLIRFCNDMFNLNKPYDKEFVDFFSNKINNASIYFESYEERDAYINNIVKEFVGNDDTKSYILPNFNKIPLKGIVNSITGRDYTIAHKNTLELSNFYDIEKFQGEKFRLVVEVISAFTNSDLPDQFKKNYVTYFINGLAKPYTFLNTNDKKAIIDAYVIQRNTYIDASVKHILTFNDDDGTPCISNTEYKERVTAALVLMNEELANPNEYKYEHIAQFIKSVQDDFINVVKMPSYNEPKKLEQDSRFPPKLELSDDDYNSQWVKDFLPRVLPIVTDENNENKVQLYREMYINHAGLILIAHYLGNDLFKNYMARVFANVIESASSIEDARLYLGEVDDFTPEQKEEMKELLEIFNEK